MDQKSQELGIIPSGDETGSGQLVHHLSFRLWGVLLSLTDGKVIH